MCLRMSPRRRRRKKMGRIAELERYIEAQNELISKLRREKEELRNLLEDVANYHDSTLPDIRKILGRSPVKYEDENDYD